MTRTAKADKGIRKTAERVMMQQTFFGMLLFAHYIQEGKEFAIRCFEANYPDALSDKRLYELSNQFYEDFYQNEK